MSKKKAGNIEYTKEDINEIQMDILATQRAESITKIDEIYNDLMITIEELSKRNPNCRNVYTQLKDKLPRIRSLVDEI